MEKTKICNCPKCGGDVYESKFTYNCECGFKCNKEIWGAQITVDDLKLICDGKETDFFDFNKEGKEWTAKLVYSASDEKVVFKFKDNEKNTATIVGKCPICGADVKETKDFFICSNYKKSCELIIGKDIKGYKISKEEVLKLLNNETLKNLKFTWKSGKIGTADIHLDEKGKIEFIFN